MSAEMVPSLCSLFCSSSECLVQREATAWLASKLFHQSEFDPPIGFSSPRNPDGWMARTIVLVFFISLSPVSPIGTSCFYTSYESPIFAYYW
jgi:hypothetical protein